MAKRRNRYKQMQLYMTCALLTDALLFVLFLIFAGLGIVWLKILTAIFAITLSGLCLAFLFLNKELLRQRSLWMTAGAAAILVCILFSLILNYPSPNPYKEAQKEEKAASEAAAAYWEYTAL